MGWLLALMAVLLMLPAAAMAQDSDVGSLTDSLDSMVPSLLEQNAIPGASVALIHGGAVVWSAGYGVADQETGAAVTADTVFSVESISKALTAWEIMRMVEAGQIDLDAPANAYLTSWQIPALGRNDPNGVTIRRILSHTAGLSVDGYHGYSTDTTDLPSTVDLLDGKVQGVQRVQVITPPGARFSYSGGGYTALQLMIEDMTGESFDALMQRDLLDPLGMDHSYWHWTDVPGVPSDERATSYTAAGAVDDTLLHVDLAAGGLFTSANDLARFFTQGMSGDRLSAESVKAMHTAVEGTDGEYGFGNFLLTLGNDSLDDGSQVVWHDGIGVGQRSIFFLIPDAEGATDEGLIILTNSGRGNVIFRDVVCAWDSWLHDGEQTKLCARW